MKLSKKIFAFTLIVAMMFSMMITTSAATSFSDVSKDHERYEAITELANRKVIDGYLDGTFLPEKPVKRSEMAKLLALNFGISEAVPTVAPFLDVDTTYWAVSYIVAVKNLGIIKGVTEEIYKPENDVTYEQVIKMLVCALNYGEPAEQYFNDAPKAIQDTDWSYGYRKMADQLKITDGVDMDIKAPATRGDVAQLLFNCLSVSPAVKVEKPGGTVSYRPGSGTVDEQNNLEKLYDVQVICTPEMNLEDTQLIKKGYIRIYDPEEKETYEMSVDGDESMYSLIGRFVDITYEERRGKYTIKTITALGDSESIDLLRVKDVNSEYVEYYDSDRYASTKKVNLEANVDVVYNNRVLLDASQFVDILKADISREDGALSYFGNVQIINYDENSLIVIDSYKSYYVNKTENSTQEVDVGKGVKFVIDVKGNDPDKVVVKKTSLSDNGTNPTTLGFSAKAIISIRASKDGTYTEYIVSQKESGSPIETGSLRGPFAGYVKIGTKELSVANDEAFNNLKVNSTASYYLDGNGIVVYVIETANKNKKFGFFQKPVNSYEDGSAQLTFYDPESKSSFTVTIEDEADSTLVRENKERLFWMDTTNSRVKSGKIKFAEEITKNDDSSVLNVEYHNFPEGEAYKSSSRYYLTPKEGEKVSIPATSGASYQRPESYGNDIKYSTITMTSSSLVTYDNPMAYVIERSEKTNTFLVIDPLRQLLSGSPVYVVKEISGTMKKNDIDVVEISCYNFKTVAVVSTPIVITKEVADAMNLQIGDVFTYYNDSSTTDVAIDNTDCVYILLRASEVAKAENRGKDVKATLEKADTVAAGNTNGFRFFGINSTHEIGTTYYNYALQIPVSVDVTNNRNAIDLARNYGGKKTYLPVDSKDEAEDSIVNKLMTIDYVNAWNRDTIVSALTPNTQLASIGTKNIFYYDKDGDENEKFRFVTDENEKAEIYENLITLDKGATNITAEYSEDEAKEEIRAAVANCSLIYTYYSNTGTLGAVYIIK